MKQTVLLLCLIMITTVNGIVDYDVSIVTDQDVDIDFDIQSEGNINITENYNHYTTEYVTTKSTNRDGVLKTVNKMFSYWFQEDELRNPDRYELDFLNYLTMFRNMIINTIRNDYIYKLELDLEAQKKINKMYQDEFNNIYKWAEGFLEPVYGQSIQCTAYLEMMKQHSDIKSITCVDGNETQTWHKVNGYAIMIT